MLFQAFSLLFLSTFFALSHADQKSTLINRMEFDPPTNPLHFKKLSHKNQAEEMNPKFNLKGKGKVPRLGRWDAHDPGYYTDAFARNYMMPLSAAAYADDPSKCLSNKFKNATISKHVLTKCEESDKIKECAGFTALAHTEKAIIVAFRGTNEFLQLLTEVSHVVLKKKEASPVGGMVAFYFSSVFQQIWTSGLQQDAERLLRDYPDYEVWVTGHSLGGAVASIAATWMLNEYELEEERIKLITFGQPRTGDTDYAVAHNQRLPRSYRVTHKRDLVPHVPPEKFESYFHHQSEIWYPSGMGTSDLFIVCNQGESNECSDKQWLDASISDHLHYFDQYLSDYGIGGCVDSVVKEKAVVKEVKEKDGNVLVKEKAVVKEVEEKLDGNVLVKEKSVLKEKDGNVLVKEKEAVLVKKTN